MRREAGLISEVSMGYLPGSPRQDILGLARFCDTTLAPLDASISWAATRWEGIKSPIGKMCKIKISRS